MEDAADLVARYHGSLSGEHGDGHARAELLPKMFGPELIDAFREFKAIWDPDGKMNPGKVSDPYPLDRYLRNGPDYRPTQVETVFRFPSDKGSFVEAAERCFGVGKCREIEAGDDVMCPSFRATREELHSTRGRARMLFEMLRGDVITDGWHSEDVKESLELCLACKGCKHDCPVRVDMATYKAEFFAHYYERKLRPLSHYALGLIYWEARLASRLPKLANKLAALGKPLVGIAPERELPEFAPFTFRDWWSRREAPATAPDATRVLLWPDTFNTYFRPQTAIAAVEVLEAAGCRVELPDRVLCCGRPLYDFGMLSLAKRQLRQILDALRPQIEAGVPLVGLEPSCVAVFRDELCELFPDDNDAKRLREQSYALSEFLTKLDWTPPKLEGRALVQGHCHHKSVMGFDDEQKLLEKTGLEVELLETGCCGMAGSFGYEAGEKYDVSMKCAEDVLLPKIRDAGANAIVVADGFSCRSQIEHGANRETVHIAELLHRALKPHAASSVNGSGNHRVAKAAAATLLGASVVGGAFVARRLRR
jgi:Fe-S oxidoreductase